MVRTSVRRGSPSSVQRTPLSVAPGPIDLTLDDDILASLPHGSDHSSDQVDPDIEALSSPPMHLRKLEDLNVYYLDDSSDEEGEADGDNEDGAGVREEGDGHPNVTRTRTTSQRDEPRKSLRHESTRRRSARNKLKIPSKPARPTRCAMKRSRDSSSIDTLDEDEEDALPLRDSLRKRSRNKNIELNLQPLRAGNLPNPPILSETSAPGPVIGLTGPSRQKPQQILTGQVNDSTAPPHLNVLPADELDGHPDPNVLLIEVLDVLPDLDPGWALRRLEGEIALSGFDKAVATVVSMALEEEGGYPRVTDLNVFGKVKASAQVRGRTYRDLDYRQNLRTGRVYLTKSLGTLEIQFARIPILHIRSMFFSVFSTYVPAYFKLLDQRKLAEKPYEELKRPRAVGQTIKGKGKGKSSQETRPSTRSNAFDIEADGTEVLDDDGNAEFEKERAFLFALLEQEQAVASELEAKTIAKREALDAKLGIECGCCFDQDVWEEMAQCLEGHLFCRECLTGFCETKLGEQSTTILCMDGSGCQVAFPESELRRFLPPKTLGRYHRLRQAAELEQAGIPGLEQCPGCHYAVVMDNPDEKLFRCENDDCKQISCRRCWKKEHIPKTCEEMEADRKLDKRHVIEDAMSDALIRRCPKCAKPYMKESGCNKMTCTTCWTVSCYVCQKDITKEGYAHFEERAAAFDHGNVSRAKRCILHDNDEAAKEHDKIVAARDAAQKKIRDHAAAEGIVLADKDLDVDVGVAPAHRHAGAQIIAGGVYPPPPAYMAAAHLRLPLPHLPPPPVVNRAGLPAALEPHAPLGVLNDPFRAGGNALRDNGLPHFDWQGDPLQPGPIIPPHNADRRINPLPRWARLEARLEALGMRRVPNHDQAEDPRGAAVRAAANHGVQGPIQRPAAFDAYLRVRGPLDANGVYRAPGAALH